MTLFYTPAADFSRGDFRRGGALHPENFLHTLGRALIQWKQERKGMSMTEEYAVSRYEEACQLLPGRLRAAALAAGRREKAAAEELRLRLGRPVYLTLPEGERPLPETQVARCDLEQVLDRATEYSRYTASETLRHGYVTARGGFRVGVCGTALPNGESNEGVRDVSSLALRIPRSRQQL